MTILVTGGAGFIGSNFIKLFLSKHNETIVNIDKFTYAGKKENICDVLKNKNHILIKNCITDKYSLQKIFETFRPRAVIHLAAESHVDNSINIPRNFIDTNIIGSFELIEISKKYFQSLTAQEKYNFKFINISTDEVYGDLSETGKPFEENDPYKPNNPYSASKAASSHIMRSYFKTYNIPTITTHCSNNYGPFQSSEKLIPMIIKKALNMENIPIYGNGSQIRDWIHVNDHCLAILKILELGIPGEHYNIGGGNELTTISIANHICNILDILQPNISSYKKLIKFVPNRPGCDYRYSINYNKIFQQTNWQPLYKFDVGIFDTVKWYVENPFYK
ncbi:dTDP-glucose 4,6-dehydratase [Candidatus Kinetoplastibacterium sorsogonicusi]|uniref:dTDP-glucose 4,6-dehydratase n=1 Tax=Candidatus Kinetoplastidibacterium kentomonadis TaxID=1576550 RepID=A0A3S7J9D7_9PROT|nr:dTDP-glucose 4,6-dehydratase [Candidatus Kinetoplastibacterium sorsogonicusi]AWD32288.1 dTDP-glucose 4,6-dehydratase [Candidatus Kinetoplastibacterium sorsogonicusi]